MAVLYLFVPLSVVIAGVMVWAVFWAIRNNQYEDLDGPAHRMLLDDDDPKIPVPSPPSAHDPSVVKAKIPD